MFRFLLWSIYLYLKSDQIELIYYLINSLNLNFLFSLFRNCHLIFNFLSQLKIIYFGITPF